MTYTVLIPARLSSTRLPEKALADIGGQPMIVRVAQRAQQSSANRVVVATDHARIVEACKQANIEVVMTRADHASGTDRLAEAADQLGLTANAIVLNVQGDEPLLSAGLMDQVAQRLMDQPNIAMATAAHPLNDMADVLNPNVVKVVTDHAGNALYFSRAAVPWARDAWAMSADILPATHPILRHIGLYAYRVGFLTRYAKMQPAPLEQVEALEQLRVLWHGEKIAVHVTEHAPPAGVDTADDLARVRAYWATQAA